MIRYLCMIELYAETSDSDQGNSLAWDQILAFQSAFKKMLAT